MSLFPGRESHHERRAIAEAEKRGWGQIKVLKRGWPDRMLFRQGRCVWVEFKAPGETPRPDQRAVHRTLRSRGETVLVIDNWRDLVPALDRLDTPE